MTFFVISSPDFTLLSKIFSNIIPPNFIKLFTNYITIIRRKLSICSKINNFPIISCIWHFIILHKYLLNDSRNSESRNTAFTVFIAAVYNLLCSLVALLVI